MNLRQLMLAERIHPREAMAIVPQICDALQFAHDQGIVHRDIKPENILIDRLGRVKVADFGIAKVVAGGEADEGDMPQGQVAATLAGNVIGTPQYMAPEQIDRPADVDHRADIYALGVVFYQMLTGELPEKELKAPSRKVRIDVRLDEIVLQALEKNPELRFQQASVMKTRVEAASGEASPRMAAPWVMDYRSKTTWFGLPLLHVTSGPPDPVTGKERVAKGIVAIGSKACGVLAFGGQAYGVFAFGGIAAGLFAFGGLAVGVVAWGGMAVALGLALGGLALGWAAIGGSAVGYYSYGSSTYGVHRLGPKAGDKAAKEFFMPWAADLLGSMGVMLVLFMALVFLVSFGVPLWIGSRGGRGSDAGKPRPGKRLRSTVIIGLIALVMALVLVVMIHQPPRFTRSEAVSFDPRELRPAAGGEEVANEYLDLLLKVAVTKGAGYGTSHPARAAAEKNLERFRARHPTQPDENCARLASERLVELEDHKARLIESGTGPKHPVMAGVQARMDALANLARGEGIVLRQGPPRRVVIEVREDGGTSVDGKVVPLENLEAELRRLSQGPRPLSAAIRCATGLPYSKAMAVLDACGRARITQVDFKHEEAVPAHRPDIQVNVLGEVRQPGAFPIRRDGSLLDAVAASGGWTEKADLRKISVLPPDSVEVQIHDLRAILAGKAVNPKIDDRAIVTIPVRLF